MSFLNQSKIFSKSFSKKGLGAWGIKNSMKRNGKRKGNSTFREK